MSMKIGFIGLGNMGGPMATNLGKGRATRWRAFDVAGTTVRGRARGRRRLKPLWRRMDAVITMLPNGVDPAASVGAGNPTYAKQGMLFIDCSTVDVESARRTVAAQAAEDAGLLSVDAPVSGGIGGASGGTLTFMAGGSTQRPLPRPSPCSTSWGKRRCIAAMPVRGKRRRFATT